jgi:hypothetical protein
MKKILILLTALAVVAFVSCKKTDDYSGNLGGSTNLDVNKVGYEYAGSLKIGSNYMTTDAKAVVVSNSGGIVTLKLTSTLPAKFKSLMSTSPYVGGNGDLDFSGQFVNSTEGVAYVNASGSQSILVRYDAKVGDQWSYTTKAGKVLTRKVTAVSTDDDFPWGMLYIKVITVEQSLPYPGFKKVVYRANHKFGLVQFEVYLEDGTVATMTLF